MDRETTAGFWAPDAYTASAASAEGPSKVYTGEFSIAMQDGEDLEKRGRSGNTPMDNYPNAW